MGGIRTFEKMNPDARIWVFQANRKLTNSEGGQIRLEIEKFLADWRAHGNELMATCTILKNRFLVVALDESFEAASGCSIDSCIRKIQDVGKVFHVDFMDRSVAVQDDENEISLYGVGEVQGAVKSGEITSSDFVYDHTIQKLGEMKTKWVVPAKESWLGRHFN